MATLSITAILSDNGKKVTVNDVSEGRNDPPSVSSVSFEIAKYNYDTNDYESIGSITLNESYNSQDEMEYYIEPYEGDLVISSKLDSTKQVVGAYSNEIIKDGIWRIEYGTDLEDAQVFLFHYNYENKLGVYLLHRDLLNHYRKDEIRYDKHVESTLLRKAVLNSLRYSAEFGQLEIIEEFDLALKDLLND